MALFSVEAHFPLKRSDGGASGQDMSVDKETVVKIAKLSRIAISDNEADAMVSELNGILGWVEQLGEVDVTGVEPMTAVIANKTRMRDDVVNADAQTGGGVPEKVLANAPAREGTFFGVPKVIE
jgi:aspartyl-tRNA(Asn)/glutamyl-tRNA(Gln) amidotransferase subunit C